MAFALTRLGEIAFLSNSAANVYHLTSGTAYIKAIHLHNTNTTTENVHIWIVPNNGAADGTAADANKAYDIDLAANETVMITFEQPLVLTDAHDTIQALSTTANKVTCQIYGATE